MRADQAAVDFALGDAVAVVVEGVATQRPGHLDREAGPAIRIISNWDLVR